MQARLWYEAPTSQQMAAAVDKAAQTNSPSSPHLPSGSGNFGQTLSGVSAISFTNATPGSEFAARTFDIIALTDSTG